MNSITLRQLARSVSSSIRSYSSKPSSSSSSSSTSKSSYPPRKSNGRTLPASTLRSLISLHHSSAGFLQDPKEGLAVGFDNAFRHTRSDPYFRGFNDYTSNQLHSSSSSNNDAGGLETLVERPRSDESRGVGHAGRYQMIYPAENIQKNFKARTSQLWSETSGQSKDSQMLSERELALQEALYGTWERGGVGMSKVEPSLDGVLEFVDAKGKTVKEYAREWQERDVSKEEI
ncbi:uncharacterized protein I303_103415 [Kwoniella dejecticola CBS 10117]|uniref:Uncharacterized protein n=1 Tax=Kwoniella dejecticola CBS 10117 TaxID=1296121 RepID=A0A1A6A6P2_9TREE|nr:uncharacterized protein I303_03437 [Kwoniella dejecticola CBS 10117]OBR85726.1 hypothetical protein I303_03437 [Kwoniella dejecticola CBS 10117]